MTVVLTVMRKFFTSCGDTVPLLIVSVRFETLHLVWGIVNETAQFVISAIINSGSGSTTVVMATIVVAAVV